MSLSEKYAYPRVKIVRESKAWEILAQEASSYGKTEGELIADLAITWTKMIKGEWNLHWPVFMANMMGGAIENNKPIPSPSPSNDALLRKREEEERRQQERKEARLAAARAELLE